MSEQEPTTTADMPAVTLPHVSSVLNEQKPQEPDAPDEQEVSSKQVTKRRQFNCRCIRFPYTISKVGEFTFDLVQVLASVTDVVLDIIVAQQLYNEQLYTLFGLSLTVFFLAQTSYAFLFTVHWGDEKPGTAKFALMALCVWPFAQLVPVFGWIESFHLKPVDKFLKYFGLDPSVELTLDELTSQEALQKRFEAKLKSHAGLLLEAIVEAVPQSMIQLTAVFMSDTLRDSPVNLLSILFSTFVIASKGYLVSLSIFKTTFIFNCATIAADVFGAFAVLTWLAYGLLVDLSGPNGLEWAMLIVLGGLLGLLGVCCLMMLLAFTFDHFIQWHLKRSGCQSSVLSEVHTSRVYAISHVFFLWGLAVVAVVPCIVIGFMLRLSSVPLLILNSFMSDYNAFPAFFKHMTRFLGSGIDKSDTELRRKISSSFFPPLLTAFIKRYTYYSSAITDHEWLKEISPMDLPLLHLGADARGVRSFTNQPSAVVVPDSQAAHENVITQSPNRFTKLKAMVLRIWDKRMPNAWKEIIKGPFPTYIAVNFLWPLPQNDESFLAVYLHIKKKPEAAALVRAHKRRLNHDEMVFVSPLKERWIESSMGMKLLFSAQLFVVGIELLATVLLVIVLIPCVLLGLLFPILDAIVRSAATANIEQPGSSLDIPLAFTVCYTVSLLVVMISWVYVRNNERLLASVPSMNRLPMKLREKPALLMKELYRRYHLIRTAAKLHETLERDLGSDVLSVVSEILGPAGISLVAQNVADV